MVQNQPGAGGIASANRLYNMFERDGSVIVKLERAVPKLAIQGDPNVNFDPLKFTWLGSLSSYAKDSYLMLVMATNPIKSVAELKEPGKSITLGGDNAASSNLIFATIAKEILGLNINVVRGYVGAAPMFLAMQRGEIDGQIIGYQLGAHRPARSVEPRRVPPAAAIRPLDAARPTFPMCRPATN